MNSFSKTATATFRINDFSIVLGTLVFLRTMPCYLWSIEDYIRPTCAVLILIICLLNISKEKWTWYIFLCIAGAYIWATMFVDHSGIITLFNFLAFAFIPIIRKDLNKKTYSVFLKIFIFFVGMSILNYMLYLAGLTFGGIQIDPLNSLKTYKYIMYPFLVTAPETPRFMSIYDEPGFIGTLCGLILIAERMNFQKRGNIIILLAGLLSLSLYFYVALIWGVILFSTKLKRKWMHLVLLLSFIVLSYNNDYMYNMLWYRFEYDSSAGQFVGDNRNGGGIEQVYELIYGTPLFFTGLGSAAVEDLQGGASLKLVIIRHGFIFVALNLLGYGILAIRQINNKKDWLFFMLFFILTLYQRPGFYGTYSIFMYTMLIYKFGESDFLKPQITSKSQ